MIPRDLLSSTELVELQAREPTVSREAEAEALEAALKHLDLSTSRDAASAERGCACLQASHNAVMNSSAYWLHQAHVDLDQALVSATGGIMNGPASRATRPAGVGSWFGPILPRSAPLRFRPVGENRDRWEDRLLILDALYIPTRYPDSLPDGAPTDLFGRLQSDDSLRHARALVDVIRDAPA